MVNRSKQKGTTAESAVVAALIAQGWPHCERRALNGVHDRGDVAGIPGVMVEVKNAKTYNVAGWLKEVEVEKAHARADIGVCWFKRPGTTDPLRWGVLMTGEQFIQLLKAAGY